MILELDCWCGRLAWPGGQFFVFLVGIGHDIGLELGILVLFWDDRRCSLVVSRVRFGNITEVTTILVLRLLCLWVGMRHRCTFDIFWRLYTISFRSFVRFLLLLLLKWLVFERCLIPCVLMCLAAYELLLIIWRVFILYLRHLYYVALRYWCLKATISFLATLLDDIRRFLLKWLILSILARFEADVRVLIVYLTQWYQFNFVTIHVELELLDKHFVRNVRQDGPGIATELSLVRGFSNGHLRNHLAIRGVALLEYWQGDLEVSTICVLGTFLAIRWDMSREPCLQDAIWGERWTVVRRVWLRALQLLLLLHGVFH